MSERIEADSLEGTGAAKGDRYLVLPKTVGIPEHFPGLTSPQVQFGDFILSGQE